MFIYDIISLGECRGGRMSYEARNISMDEIR